MGNYYKNIICLLLLLTGLVGQSKAQDLQLEGYFLQDSAMLGERIAYVLKASYGEGYNIIFPDSSYNFSPFELLERKTYITQTREGVTVDSAVYFVSNFSLDPFASLQLPVFEIFKYDTLIHQTNEASVALKLMIDEIPQELQFQENNVYQPIETEFNYPLWAGILALFLILVLAVALIFGNKIKRQWDIWLEKQRYKRFVKRWENAEQDFAANPTMDNADELLGLWKTYMEHLKQRPFREWTTTEIADFLENREVIQDFREIEMIIYAGKEGKQLPQACQNLRDICTTTYQQKITATSEHN